jgi:hypothetical protein
MTVTLQRETTEYVYMGFTGNVPSVGAEVAFLAAGVRPTTEWSAATLIPNNSHPLWDDAVSSGITGDYYVARLVGSFSGTGVTLTPGDYQPWVRLTDTIERPVRIAPVAVTIA